MDYEGLNEHRAEYYARIEAIGYTKDSFRRPIFNCRNEFREQLVDDIIFVYRNRYDPEYAIN